jgi:hypothetical protein
LTFQIVSDSRHFGFDPDQGGTAVFDARLIQIKAASVDCVQTNQMWIDISTAPKDRTLSLAVIDAEGLHALVFPCRRVADGWVNAISGARIDVRPTHWRDWEMALSGPACEKAIEAAKS